MKIISFIISYTIDEEPVYCKQAEQAEFGLIVGCDGSEYRYKWFHLQCVGLRPGLCSKCARRKHNSSYKAVGRVRTRHK